MLLPLWCVQAYCTAGGRKTGNRLGVHHNANTKTERPEISRGSALVSQQPTADVVKIPARMSCVSVAVTAGSRQPELLIIQAVSVNEFTKFDYPDWMTSLFKTV
ncbi:hypothetical protein DVQ97_20385 [Yersinia enterocolitica]|nr:hypothetical protein [Yersinia enterocolitica]